MMKEYGLQESVKYALESGKPVLIFDHEKREGETDMVFASQFVDFNAIRMLRKESWSYVYLKIRQVRKGATVIRTCGASGERGREN